MSFTRRTVVFAKCPEPGRVKTRLAPALGLDGAAELAAAMLADLVDRLHAAGDLAVGIAFAPADQEAWFRRRFDGVDLFPQRGFGLGSRMRAFFDDRLGRAPGETVVVLGADAPLAPIDAIRNAHDRLEQGADVVLGPDRGGGYWCLGLSRPAPVVFDVPMSTRGMCVETLEAARAAGLEVELVAGSFDVDEPRDLDRLRREIARRDPGVAGYPRRTAEFLAQRATR